MFIYFSSINHPIATWTPRQVNQSSRWNRKTYYKESTKPMRMEWRSREARKSLREKSGGSRNRKNSEIKKFSVSWKRHGHCFLGLYRNDWCGCDAEKGVNHPRCLNQGAERTRKALQISSATEESIRNLAWAWLKYNTQVWRFGKPSQNWLDSVTASTLEPRMVHWESGYVCGTRLYTWTCSLLHKTIEVDGHIVGKWSMKS